MIIPEHLLRTICAHAEDAYPEECCGLVLAPTNAPSEPTRIRPCRNAQDEFHALDPDTFPRTSRNAYFIDPKDLLAVERECRERGERVCLIYHSHPDVGVYFSEEDQRCATVDGEPLHPGVDYLVVSVTNGKAEALGVFTWNASAKEFVRNNQTHHR